MSAVLEFMRMEGYGGYVWSAYGLTVVVVLALVVWSARAHAAARRRLASLEDARTARR